MSLRLTLFLSSTLVCILMSFSAQGQIDPLLLPSSANTPTAPTFENDRYTIRNKTTTTDSKTTVPQPSITVVPATESKVEKNVKVEKKESKKTEEHTGIPVNPPTLIEYDSNNQNLFKNIIEVKTKTFYVVNNSKSNYKYRRYNTELVGVGLTVDSWFEPTWGISAGYSSTLNGFTQGLTSSTNLKSSEQWSEISLQSRQDFSDKDQGPYLVSKIGYSDYQKKLPTSNTDRASLQTSGVFIELESFVPTSERYYWQIDLKFKPSEVHREKQTALNLGSGQKPKSTGWGFGLGGKWIFEKKTQLFWNVEYYQDTHIFSGTTSQPDPWTGATLTTVPVKNSFLFFNLGFIWGG